MQTNLVYIGLLLGGVIFSFLYERKNNVIWLICIIVLMAFFAGFRGDSVGCDTENYSVRFDLILDGRSQFAYGFEETFKKIVSFLGLIIHDKTFVFVSFAVLTYGLILLRLKDFSKYISLGWSFVAFYAMFYALSLNVMRQFCAVAIVFYASRFLEKRMYAVFSVLVFASFCFHTSGLLGFLFLFINFLFQKKNDIKQKIISTGCIVTLISCIGVFLSYASKYESYFSKGDSSNIGFLLPAKLFLLIASSYFCFGDILFARKKHVFVLANNCALMKNVSTYENDKSILLFVISSYVLGLFLTGLGYFFPYMDRVGLYFYLFEPVYVGMVMKNRCISVNNLCFGGVYLFLFLYIFISGLNSGGQCQIPYVFVWENL